MRKATAYKIVLVDQAIDSAEPALRVFEWTHPSDTRPQEAIEAARAWRDNPTRANRRAAYHAAKCAIGAAEAALEANHVLASRAATAAACAAHAAATGNPSQVAQTVADAKETAKASTYHRFPDPDECGAPA